jgi:hypothetical protein
MTGTEVSGLNPADYFTLALDDEIRRDGMPGSLCAFVLELRRPPDVAQLAARIEEFAQRFPRVSAALQQRGRRFYWVQRENPPQIFFDHVCSGDGDEAQYRQQFLEALINHREARETLAPLTFHLLRGNTKSLFVLRWIHPLCDARGADLILQYLCCGDAQQRTRFGVPSIDSLVNAQLAKYGLWQKIALFLKAKSYIKQIDSLQSILPTQSGATPEKLAFAVQRLSAEDSAAVAKLARQHVGIAGTSLYYIGCLMRALEKIQPHSPGDAYCATYAFNLRKQKALTPLLGNHVGGLFAQAPRSIVQDRAALFRHLKQQNAQVIRQQLDYAFLPLMWAGSWLPLQRYGKILRRSNSSETERSSFWFSDIGQAEMPEQTFCGAEVGDLLHLCQITNPPALALLSCRYRQRLCFTYNFIAPLMQPEWIERLQAAMLDELLAA